MSGKKMTLFEGLAWLYANPGKTLEVNRVGFHPYSAKVVGKSLTASSGRDGAWVLWQPNVDDHLEYTLAFPARKMPELPEGDRWSESGGFPSLVNKTGFSYVVCTDEQCEFYRMQAIRYKALVEEYETRPKSCARKNSGC